MTRYKARAPRGFSVSGATGYWQAWVYLATALVASTALFFYLKRADPALLERRLRGPASEKALSQKLLQRGAFTFVTGTVVVSLLDHRYGWSHVPVPVEIAGHVLFALSFWIVFIALRENTFASTNINVEAGQRVISTGPYAIVRHPYYSGLCSRLSRRRSHSARGGHRFPQPR
jgi:protein-S-isoprenylcysteine O-methyltransferase Ste14